MERVFEEVLSGNPSEEVIDEFEVVNIEDIMELNTFSVTVREDIMVDNAFNVG